MKTLIVIFAFLLFSCDNHQRCKSYNVAAFTHYQINQGTVESNRMDFLIEIFDKPDGNVIFYLPPDEMLESTGWSVSITDKSKGFFKIANIWSQASNKLRYWDENWMEEYEFVWIKQGVVGLNTENYDGQVVNLFEYPDRSSNVSGRFANPQTVVVLDVCENWAYVEAKDENNKPIYGWLPPEDQCANPLSTCS